MTVAELADAIAKTIETKCDSMIGIPQGGIHACTKDKGHNGPHASGDFEWVALNDHLNAIVVPARDVS